VSHRPSRQLFPQVDTASTSLDALQHLQTLRLADWPADRECGHAGRPFCPTAEPSAGVPRALIRWPEALSGWPSLLTFLWASRYVAGVPVRLVLSIIPAKRHVDLSPGRMCRPPRRVLEPPRRLNGRPLSLSASRIRWSLFRF